MYAYKRSSKILLNLEYYQLAQCHNKEKLLEDCNSSWKSLLQGVTREVSIILVIEIFEIMKALYLQNLSTTNIKEILDQHFEKFNNLLTESNTFLEQDQKKIIYLIFNMIPEEPKSFFYFWNKTTPISKNIHEIIKFGKYPLTSCISKKFHFKLF